jgi:iron complex outermembrane receptor protein
VLLCLPPADRRSARSAARVPVRHPHAARRRTARAVAAAVFAGLVLDAVAPGAALGAQPVAPDSARRLAPDSARARRLEAVTVNAVRSGDAAVARTTLGRADLQRAYTGQDVPLLLQQAPAVTTFAHSGSQWNYSYFSLRGVAQSRINLTLDGVPLNEPEDQQIYFSNFADLGSSLQSVQVQRGVGTSSYGHASLGGSVNFESEALAVSGGGGEAQVGGGRSARGARWRSSRAGCAATAPRSTDASRTSTPTATAAGRATRGTAGSYRRVTSATGTS